MPVFVMGKQESGRMKGQMFSIRQQADSAVVHALSATARPASTPSALARKEATAWVDSGILQHLRSIECVRFVVKCWTIKLEGQLDSSNLRG